MGWSIDNKIPKASIGVPAGLWAYIDIEIPKVICWASHWVLGLGCIDNKIPKVICCTSHWALGLGSIDNEIPKEIIYWDTYCNTVPNAVQK